MRLSDCKKGIYKISKRYGGWRFISKMDSMGMTVGEELEVLLNQNHYPMLIKVRGSEISLGKGMAGKLEMEDIE